MKLNTNTVKAAVATGATVLAGSSYAVDTAPIVSALTDAATAAGVVGAAALAVVVVIKTFKYVRSSF